MREPLLGDGQGRLVQRCSFRVGRSVEGILLVPPLEMRQTIVCDSVLSLHVDVRFRSTRRAPPSERSRNKSRASIGGKIFG